MYIVLGLLIGALILVIAVFVGKSIGFGLGSDFEQEVDEEPWPSGPIMPEDKHPKRVA